MHTHCLRCGRPLRATKFKKLGFGYTCYKNAVAEALNKQGDLFDKNKEYVPLRQSKRRGQINP